MGWLDEPWGFGGHDGAVVTFIPWICLLFVVMAVCFLKTPIRCV